MSAARKTKNGKENKEIKKSETEEDDRKDADRKKNHAEEDSSVPG